MNDDLLKSGYGSVRPYTRHTSGCTNSVNDNSCRCPKWLYVFKVVGKEKQRYSLNTPSWADAMAKATYVLKGLDPEVAQGRAKEMVESEQITVRDAMHLWVARTENKLGEDSTTLKQYRHLEELVTKWATQHGIKYAKDITTAQLERWYGTKEWTRLAPTTRKQRWAVLRVMFGYMVKVKAITESPADPIEAATVTPDHVQGPYTDRQVGAILSYIGDAPPGVTADGKDVYVTRLRAFVHLLIESGCDVSDAILFGPHKLAAVRVGGETIDVFRYRRLKTKTEAVIPVSAELVRMLRTVPVAEGSAAEMPFRIPGCLLKAAQNRWSRRVMYVFKAAGVHHVDLPDGRTKPANVKQFRHTAAVRWLREGQRAEEVARMLGHTDTEMVRRHYAPWVPDLDLAHITRVVSMRTPAQSARV